MKRKPIKKRPVTKRAGTRKLNPAALQTAAERQRTSYRRGKGSDYELTGSVTLRALEFIDDAVSSMQVTNTLTGDNEVHPVFRLTYVAELLNVSYMTFWRWTSETQQVPAPVLFDNSRGREYGVYHLEEVRVMVAVIGQHLKSFKYYRKDHDGTRKQVFDQIEALRMRNFNHGEKPHGSQAKGQSARRKGKIRRPGGKRSTR
jgi:hypothetical protein